MARGVCLGILLICLVQAEHGCCFRPAQGQSQNSNRYVGFSQQDSGLRRHSGSYSQNQLRQAGVQSSSFSAESAANSGLPPIRFMQSSLFSKPGSETLESKQTPAQQIPKKLSFSLSTAIASGSSFTNRKQNQVPATNQKNIRPVQQSTASWKYQPRSSGSLQTPSRRKAASNQSGTLRVPGTAGTSSSHSQQSYSPVGSATLFGPGADPQHKNFRQTHTSGSAPAKRVSRPSTSAFSYSRKNPGQAPARNPHRSTLFQGTGRTARGSNGPASSSSYGSSSQSRMSKEPSYQPRGHRMSYTSVEYGPSGERYAPTKVHGIPDLFGGFAIKRLKDPADQDKGVKKPVQTHKPQMENWWKRT